MNHTQNLPDNAALAQAQAADPGPYFTPAVDVLDAQDELVLHADLPGATPESIEIRYEDGVLSLKAAVLPRNWDNARALRQEYVVGSYYRAFRLGDEFDAAKFQAEFKAGVLELRMPKAEAARPRRIPVKTA